MLNPNIKALFTDIGIDIPDNVIIIHEPAGTTEVLVARRKPIPLALMQPPDILHLKLATDGYRYGYHPATNRLYIAKREE